MSTPPKITDPMDWGNDTFLLPTTSPALLVLLNSAVLQDAISTIGELTTASAKALNSASGEVVAQECHNKPTTGKDRACAITPVSMLNQLKLDGSSHVPISLRSFIKIAGYVTFALERQPDNTNLKIMEKDEYAPLKKLWATRTTTNLGSANPPESLTVAQLDTLVTGQAMLRQNSVPVAAWRAILVDVRSILFTQMCSTFDSKEMIQQVTGLYVVDPSNTSNKPVVGENNRLFIELPLDFVCKCYIDLVNRITSIDMKAGQLTI